MIELCKINRLRVVRDTPQGLYLEEPVKENSGKERSETQLPKERSSAARFTGKSEDVLLPRAELPQNVKIGDEMDVFIYLDSSDRYTATLKFPKICLGAPALLKVVQVTKIGIFLDWGLSKNLLLPFKEVVRPLFYDPLSAFRTPGEAEFARGALRPLSEAEFAQGTQKESRDMYKTAQGILRTPGEAEFAQGVQKQARGTQKQAQGAVQGMQNKAGDTQGSTLSLSKCTDLRLTDEELAWLEGRELPVVLYIDKTGRPAATMRVYDYLSTGGDYTEDSAIEATVIQINPDIGVFVAVADRFFGMINIKEITSRINVGDRIFGRVSKLRDDGKYMVSLTMKAHLQMNNDAQILLKRLKEAGGSLKVGDKSSSQDIMRELGMSKKAFKRAVGQLYKQGKVVPGDSELAIVSSE